MKKPLMSGIKLYYEAVIQKQHAGKMYIVQLRDVVDESCKKYNEALLFEVHDDYYGKKGHAISVKGSRTNFMANEARLIDAFMNGLVLQEVSRDD